jgi:hypothetical protein
MESKKMVPAVNTSKFYLNLVGLFLILLVFQYVWPEVFPFGLFTFWRFGWDWNKLNDIPWMFLFFGPCLALVVSIITKNKYHENVEISETYGDNITVSLKAGIFEELSFRWLTFYYLIFSFTWTDIISEWVKQFGLYHAITSHWIWIVLTFAIAIGLIFLGVVVVAFASAAKSCLIWMAAIAALIGIFAVDIVVFSPFIKWVYTASFIPFSDWISGGKLHEYLYDYGWIAGAALLSSNAKFRDGHSYQGLLGLGNSWIIGMLMFWFMFNFGLFSAMLLHVLYDIAIDSIRYVDARLELARS